jgi:hypothetical protein
MQSPPPALKKALISAGFEIYRTGPNSISLADRVRDNLIMDSGVKVLQGARLAIQLVLRAQAADFPGEDAEGLYARARGLSSALESKGYREVAATTVAIPDPGDRSRTLDTWYEVSYEREVAGEAELYVELRYALGVPKVATRT